jgi:hypothetical protein
MLYAFLTKSIAAIRLTNKLAISDQAGGRWLEVDGWPGCFMKYPGLGGMKN